MLPSKILQYSAEIFQQIKSFMLAVLQYVYSNFMWEHEFIIIHS